LYEQPFEVNFCGNKTTKYLYGNYSPASEFYVFVGVTAFLYCLGILLLYVFGDDKYRNVEQIPIIVSMFALLRLCYISLVAMHRTYTEDMFSLA